MRCRYLPGHRLRALTHPRQHPAIDPESAYPAPWRDEGRVQVMVPGLGCVFVRVGEEEWAGLEVREYLTGV